MQQSLTLEVLSRLANHLTSTQSFALGNNRIQRLEHRTGEGSKLQTYRFCHTLSNIHNGAKKRIQHDALSIIGNEA